jgi:hypothetical protein
MNSVAYTYVCMYVQEILRNLLISNHPCDHLHRLIRSCLISASHALNRTTTPHVANLLRLTCGRCTIRRRWTCPRLIQIIEIQQCRIHLHLPRHPIPESSIQRSSRWPSTIWIIQRTCGVKGLPLYRIIIHRDGQVCIKVVGFENVECLGIDIVISPSTIETIDGCEGLRLPCYHERLGRVRRSWGEE